MLTIEYEFDEYGNTRGKESNGEDVKIKMTFSRCHCYIVYAKFFKNGMSVVKRKKKIRVLLLTH